MNKQTVTNQYNLCLDAHNHLRSISDGSDKTYFPKQEKLKIELNKLMDMDFSLLESKELLNFCAMVSSHRPVQPFNFLVACGILAKI